MIESKQINSPIETAQTIKEYFFHTLPKALANQKVEAEAETVYYLVNLLAFFAQTENLYPATESGTKPIPLALLYGQALEAKELEERQRLLQHLGDVALLISGVFPDSLSRKVVDVDYYIGMGRNAYSYLATTAQKTPRRKPLKKAYQELSERFSVFVDILGEVGESSGLNPHADPLRLYEISLKTGSRRASEKLRQLGIEPLNQAHSILRLN